MPDFKAIDARFLDMQSQISSNVAVCTDLSARVGSAEKEIDVLQKEVGAIRIAKHEHGNQLNLHKRDIDTVNDKVSEMSINIKELTQSINKFIKFSYVLTGMGTLAGTGAFVYYLKHIL